MMQTLGNWLSQPLTVWLLTACLAAIAGWCALRFETELLSVSEKLRRALTALEGLRNPQDFAAAFDTTCDAVQAALREDRILSAQWDACVRGMLVLGHSVSSQREPEDFFHSSKVLLRPTILRYRTLPGVLVGMGLVFTFLGIAVVIHQASTALVDAGDPAALRTLLSAAALKFWTSLTGVALSIICAQHCRSRIQEFTVQLGRFTRELSCLAPLAGPQRMLDEMASMRADLGTIAEKTLAGLLETTTGVLKSAVDESIGRMTAPVERLYASLEALRENLETLTGQVVEACTNLENATATFATSLGESSQKLREDFSDVTGSATKVRQSFGAAAVDAAKTWKSLNKLSSMTDKLHAAMESLSRLEGVPESLTATGESLRQAADDLSTVWDGHAGRVEHLDQQLASTLTNLPGVFDQYAGALRTYTGDLDAHLTSTLDTLMQWVQRIEALQSGALVAVPAPVDGHSHSSPSRP